MEALLSVPSLSICCMSSVKVNGWHLSRYWVATQSCFRSGSVGVARTVLLNLFSAISAVHRVRVPLAIEQEIQVLSPSFLLVSAEGCPDSNKNNDIIRANT